MMEQGNKLQIGYIHACIPGDVRYSTAIDVHILDDWSIEVSRYENAPAGGMDSFTRSVRVNERKVVIPVDAVTPAAVMRAIKRFCGEDLIKRYGKPTKRFEWYLPGNERLLGLSAARCKATLDDWRAVQG